MSGASRGPSGTGPVTAEAQPFQRRLAADPAGAGDREVPFEGGKVQRHQPGQLDVDYVVALLFVDVPVDAVADAAQLCPGRQDAFAEHEPHGELEVGARRPHGDGHRLPCAPVEQTDLKGLLAGQAILSPVGPMREDLPGQGGHRGPRPVRRQRLVPRPGHCLSGPGRLVHRSPIHCSPIHRSPVHRSRVHRSPDLNVGTTAV